MKSRGVLLLLVLSGLAGRGEGHDGGLRVVLSGEADSERAPHGAGNVYAPEVHRDGDHWRMWYGGQGKDGHDRIHLAESTDGVAWTKRGVVLDVDGANHVNDPSVARVGGAWWMFYTVAERAEWDEIAAATSADGVRWEKRGVVLPKGYRLAWDGGKVGRPSVLHEDGVFRLWYDGQPTAEAAKSSEVAAAIQREGRAVGYAESRDGLTWRRAAAPVFREGAGAVHVCRVGNGLVMLIEAHAGVRWAHSRDGLAWTARGLLAPIGPGNEDKFGRVTPQLVRAGVQDLLFFGAASRATWDGNRIASERVRFPE